LSALTNKSFECGIVPDQLKIARVCPIFKGGDQTDFTSYLSSNFCFLPAFSKIFHTRLMTDLEKHSVLTENQFGFRSNRDTCLAVVDMIDKVTEKLDAYNTVH